MDNNQNNPINPASPNMGNTGATDSVAPIEPNKANVNVQPKPVAPGTPVDNLVQDIVPANSNPAPTSTAGSASVSTNNQATETPAAETAQAAASVADQPSAEPARTAAQPAAPIQTVNNFSNPTPAPVQAPAQSTQPYGAPKKSHAGLIVGIIVVLLLALGGLGAVLFYQQHEKTERVLADGLVKLATSKALTANSTINIKVNDDDMYDGALESAKITLLSSKNEKLEMSTNAKIELTIHNVDTMNAEAEVMEGENAIYFRIVDSGNIPSVVAKAAEDDLDIKSVLEAAFVSVGDSWYEVPYSKIDDSGEMKKSIDCVREKLSNATEGENWNKIQSLYQENQFISIADDAKIEKVNGYKKYPLTIDKEKGEKFFDALEDSDLMKEVESCSDDLYGSSSQVKGTELYDMEEYESEDDYDSFDSDWSGSSNLIVEPKYDEEEIKEDTFNITLGITPWSHEIVWVGYDAEIFTYAGHDESWQYSGETAISYEANLATPGNTKSIEELTETLTKSLSDSSKQMYYDAYCTEEENYGGYKDETECKKAVDEQFGDNASSDELEDVLSNLMYMSI